MAQRLLMVLVAGLIAVTGTAALAATATDPGGTFIDDDGNVHEGSIEAIAAAGLTSGCNPPLDDHYCPRDPVTRAQMAKLLALALGLGPADTDFFIDDDGSVFEDAINRLAAAGITSGCNAPGDTGGRRYCPKDPVTRGQMAKLLERAYALTDDGGGDRFTDDDTSVFERSIDRLATAGITKGCNPPNFDRFCPRRHVTRDQVATFLARAQGLDPLIPPVRCSVFPSDSIWNTKISDLPVAPNSTQMIQTIGASATLHADFGSGEWPPGSGAPIGIPFIEVEADEPVVAITYTSWPGESDSGPWPIPLDSPVEGGPSASGDRHVIVVDRHACMLYELFSAYPTATAWEAANGASYDLTSNDLRPDGWTSADAAGLPILPGLVTYDEVASGEIKHAIRFTAPQTRSEHVWPARHDASSLTGSQYPPMGQRFRLRSDFDISGYPQPVRVILTAMKEYGLILADNGSAWYISGAPDERWDNDTLHAWDDIPGSAFEAVDVSSLMVGPDSGQAGS